MNPSARRLFLLPCWLALTMALPSCGSCPESFGPKGSRSLVPIPPPTSPPTGVLPPSYTLNCCGGRGQYEVAQGYSWGKVRLRWSSTTALKVTVTLAECAQRQASDCVLAHEGSFAITPDPRGFYYDEYTVLGQGIRLHLSALNDHQANAATLFLDAHEDEGVSVSFGEQCPGI